MLLYPSKSMPAWDMGFSSIQYVPQTNAPHARMNAVVNGPPDREAYIYDILLAGCVPSHRRDIFINSPAR